MSKRVLLTGVNGFTGRYLAAEMAAAGYEVFGLAHRQPHEDIPGVAYLRACDLSDTEGLARVLSEVRPDKVAHLAAIAFVAHGDVESIYRANLLGARNLLEAISQCGGDPDAVLLASSANVYGNATGGVLDESTPPAPANDYAVSKLAMELVARLYAERLPIIITRPFNYTGVGQSESFLLPKIVGHIRRDASFIELGNLDVARDFSDVRTVVNYYRRLLECPAAIGETFNICSGQAHTLNEVLDVACEIAGHSIEVRVNPAFVRANEVKVLLGSREKLDKTVGHVQWDGLRDTLRWMLLEGSEIKQ